jgi:hypothetical protein
LEGARARAKRLGLKIVYDRTYSPSMVEIFSTIRAHSTLFHGPLSKK